MKTSTLLRNAKTVLEETGWCRNTLSKHKRTGEVTHVCAIGSLCVAAGAKVETEDGRPYLTDIRRSNHGVFLDAENTLKDVGRLLFPDAGDKFYFSIPSVNDGIVTSKSEVLAWFDAAIATAKVRESQARG